METTGQQHAGLGVGEFSDQCHRNRRRIDTLERCGQFVLAGLPGWSRCPLGRARQSGQSFALRTSAIGVGGDGAGHDCTPGQRGIQCLPGQVIADMEPIQPIGGLEGPHRHGEQHHHQRGGAATASSTTTSAAVIDQYSVGAIDYVPTATRAPEPATVS